MGFGFGAIGVVRGNRSLLKKRKFKDIKTLLLEESGKTEVEFHKVSSIELAKIKTRIRKEAYRKTQKEIAIYGMIAIVLLVSFGWLFIYIFFSN